MFCECGHLLIAEPEPEAKKKEEEPRVLSSREPSPSSRPPTRWPTERNSTGRQRPASISPSWAGGKEKPKKGWEYWLGTILILFFARAVVSLLAPPTGIDTATSIGLTNKRFTPDFTLSYRSGRVPKPSSAPGSGPPGPSSGRSEPVRRNAADLAPELRAALDRLPPEEKKRCERIQLEAREILFKCLTQEEYELLYETSSARNRAPVTKDMLSRVASLMKKIDSMLTAEEKQKVAEANALYQRLVGPGR
jgi:hypothetical protein